jgi:tetratricopeptide (TPR) repeat protein
MFGRRRAPKPGSPKLEYDAFISYSHAKDRPIAAALQSTVQKLGKPWYRRRALRLFRDDTSLSASPQLWPSIERALGQARYLALLASPEAAASPWVNKELRWWLEHKSADTILIGLTGGKLEWDAKCGDFGWREGMPLPPALKGAFATEPRWTDLSPYHAGAALNDTRFVELSADFAATLHGIPKEDLLSQEVRQQRRALRLALSAASALAVLLALAGWLWIVAEHQKRQIAAQRDRAEHALVSATDTILELARTYQHADTATGAVTDAIAKLHDLLGQLTAGVELDVGMRLTQATVLDETAETLLIWGRSSEALDAAREAQALSQGLVSAEPDNLDYAHRLEIADAELGKTLFISADFDAALSTYRRALTIGQDLLAKDTANADRQHDLFLSLMGIGFAELDKNDYAPALDAFQQAQAIAIRLKEINPSDPAASDDLAWVKGGLDEVQREMASAMPQR